VWPGHLGAFDAMYTLVKLLELRASVGIPLSEARAALPHTAYVTATEFCPWEVKGRVMRILLDKHRTDSVDLVDGIKVYVGDGFVLVRPDPDEPAYHIVASVADPERGRQLGAGPRPVEHRVEAGTVLGFDPLTKGPLEHVEGVGERLVLRQRPAPFDPAGDEEDDHEADVDERDRGTEEVIVVGGDELADLVDEGAESETSHDRGEMLDIPVEVGEQQDDRDEHERAAPQHVGDMEPPAAELREPGQGEERPDPEERDDRGDQEAFDQQRPVTVAKRPRKAEAHGASIGG